MGLRSLQDLCHQQLQALLRYHLYLVCQELQCLL